MSNEQLNKLSAWSTFATALVAIAALVLAAFQLAGTNAAQREATAQDTYKEYLKLAVENPDIADGLAELPKQGTKEAVKYGWFVSYFLHSAEHAYLVDPSKEWRAAISNQVCLHKAFLKASEYQNNLKKHYDERFQTLVDEALEKC
jgi:hypothetical protein